MDPLIPIMAIAIIVLVCIIVALAMSHAKRTKKETDLWEQINKREGDTRKREDCLLMWGELCTHITSDVPPPYPKLLEHYLKKALRHQEDNDILATTLELFRVEKKEREEKAEEKEVAPSHHE